MKRRRRGSPPSPLAKPSQKANPSERDNYPRIMQVALKFLF
jgi:hypothetical protein